MPAIPTFAGMRWLRTSLLVAASVAALATATLLLLAGTPTTADNGDTPTKGAVRAVIDGDAEPSKSAVPADFEDVMGYQPVLRDGRLVDPYAECSTVMPLPADFAAACAEHDLGYDLLRYASNTGEPLGRWAREAIDDRMAELMRAACADRPTDADQVGCSLTAAVAVAGVRLNTVRQLYGLPDDTVASIAVTAGAAVTGASMLALVLLPYAARVWPARHTRRPVVRQGVWA